MLNYSDDPIAAIELTQRSVAGVLRADKTEKRMVTDMFAQVDAAIAACFASAQYKPPCRKGCALCCHIQVEAMVPEVLVMMRYLHSKPRKLRLAVFAAAQAAEAQAAAMSIEERCEAKLPCPMLQEGSCAVYPVRPLSCRRFFVADRDYCVKAFGVKNGNVPLLSEPFFLPTAAGAGMNLGLSDVGLFGGHVELVTAIAAAARSSRMFDDYMHGKVFGRVIDTAAELQQFMASEKQARYARSLISGTPSP